ncbi:hypothetical protein MU852_07885 [Brevundimonas albigilva]|uniref:hypothetical protein n=1 Tax=Brevundimonas albigilva TaxID=1312364 RepID=UPI00201B78C7|nr:hypothetical protein [Brevundimonas albigilva]UQV19640.1 hypothetical protein MU852_07885 [Brevundimonas albigilva]
MTPPERNPWIGAESAPQKEAEKHGAEEDPHCIKGRRPPGAIEDLAERQRGKITFKLSTYRPPQPRYIADLDEAEDAFAREVTASLQDPVIVAR